MSTMINTLDEQGNLVEREIEEAVFSDLSALEIVTTLPTQFGVMLIVGAQNGMRRPVIAPSGLVRAADAPVLPDDYVSTGAEKLPFIIGNTLHSITINQILKQAVDAVAIAREELVAAGVSRDEALAAAQAELATAVSMILALQGNLSAQVQTNTSVQQSLTAQLAAIQAAQNALTTQQNTLVAHQNTFDAQLITINSIQATLSTQVTTNTNFSNQLAAQLAAIQAKKQITKIADASITVTATLALGAGTTARTTTVSGIVAGEYIDINVKSGVPANWGICGKRASATNTVELLVMNPALALNGTATINFEVWAMR